MTRKRFGCLASYLFQCCFSANENLGQGVCWLFSYFAVSVQTVMFCCRVACKIKGNTGCMLVVQLLLCFSTNSDILLSRCLQNNGNNKPKPQFYLFNACIRTHSKSTRTIVPSTLTSLAQAHLAFQLVLLFLASFSTPLPPPPNPNPPHPQTPTLALNQL